MLNLQHLYGHLHVQLVTVCEYEQTPSRGVGGVAHTRCFPYMLYSKKNGQSPITHVKLATSQNPIFTVIFMSSWSTHTNAHEHPLIRAR